MALLLEMHYRFGKLDWQGTEGCVRIVHGLQVWTQLHQSACSENKFDFLFGDIIGIGTDEKVPLAIQFGQFRKANIQHILAKVWTRSFYSD